MQRTAGNSSLERFCQLYNPKRIISLYLWHKLIDMNFSENSNPIRWIIIIVSFMIITIILWNTYTFFQIFKNEERIKMNLWATAQKTLINAKENTEVDLPLQIFNNNTTIPLILTENDVIINSVNIDDEIIKDDVRAKEFLNDLKNENEPITIIYAPGKFQKLYYGNSSLIHKLKYYPVALSFIIVLCGILIYNFYLNHKIATQNKLWAGMAKETAHQIGTPLSSLIGWLEILKLDNIDESVTSEIEKDIERLQTITDRFSKIGSVPKLELKDAIEETKKSYDYLVSRFSNQIDFSFSAPEHPILILMNPTLHSWTIENLVKNAIDAMKGRGKLVLEIKDDNKHLKINVTDTGSGIPKKDFQRIFETGYTTKKRGWGLGLSLTRRIVEEYHKGSVKVLQSEIGKGTTMQIVFVKS